MEEEYDDKRRLMDEKNQLERQLQDINTRAPQRDIGNTRKNIQSET